MLIDLYQQETPNPGAYDIKDFVQEMDTVPIRQTYRFRDSGRKKTADNSRKGVTLMPGLYKHRTFVDDIGKRQITYSFKGCDRYHVPTALVGYMDRVSNMCSVNTTYGHKTF